MIDPDKLRALDEAANEAWTEYLTLGSPHPSVTPEARERFAFMTGFCSARRQSDAAILAMTEERRLTKAALADPNSVHVNMLRGEIAMPSLAQIIHLYGATVLRKALGEEKAHD